MVLSFGLHEAKEEIDINNYFKWELDSSKDYMSDVEHLYDNVFSDEERKAFDEASDKMNLSHRVKFSLSRHNRHGKTRSCKFCLYELAEIIMRDRQE